jgi:hypothetical protein
MIPWRYARAIRVIGRAPLFGFDEILITLSTEIISLHYKIMSITCGIKMRNADKVDNNKCIRH